MDKAVAAAAVVGGSISLAGNARRKKVENEKKKRNPKKGGQSSKSQGAAGAAIVGLLGAVPLPISALVVAGASVYLGMKLLNGGVDIKAIERGSSDIEGVLQNGDGQESYPLEEEVELFLKKEAEIFLKSQQNGSTYSDGGTVEFEKATIGPVTSSVSTPGSTTSELRRLEISASPFNTAPSSPSLFPESPFHDAAGELEFEDLNGFSSPYATRGRDVDFLGANNDSTPPVGAPREESDDSCVSAVTSEHGGRRNSISADSDKASVHALLERARAAAARVDKMHASINAMVKSKN